MFLTISATPIHLPVVGIAACVATVVLLVGCMRCRKKLTEEEKQQKYFERFRKSHMRQVKNGVDIIRPSTYQSHESTSVDDTRTVSENSYETLNSQMPAILVATPSSNGDHSFFDDSFQTVIEASSCNQTTNTTFPGNQSRNQLLPVHSQVASYLTLLPDSSGSQLCTSQCCHGTVNEAFMDSKLSMSSNPPVSSSSSSSASFSSSNNESSLDCAVGFYISNSSNSCNQSDTDTSSIENQSPGYVNGCQRNLGMNRRFLERMVEGAESEDINKERPTGNDSSDAVRRHIGGIRGHREETEHLLTFSATTDVKMLTDVDIDQYSSIKLTERDNSMLPNLSSIEDSLKHCEKIKDKNLQKLLFEGPQQPATGQRDFQTEQMTMETECFTKRKISSPLVLPRMPGVGSNIRGRKSTIGSTISGVSDHTYQSLTSDLYQDYNKRDSLCSHHDQDEFNLDEFNTPLSHKILDMRRRSLEQAEIEMERERLAKGSDHTYESLKFSTSSAASSSAKASTLSTGVVIIGRKISHPYEAGNSTENYGKESADALRLSDRLLFSETKAKRDMDERYSPFPSAKRLAIKSSFKQINGSPKFAAVSTISQKVPQFSLCKPNNSLESLSVDALNIRTPEIVVENSPKCFELDATVFVSPKRNFITQMCRKSFRKTTDDLPSISPLCTYETMKHCTNMKYNYANGENSRKGQNVNDNKSKNGQYLGEDKLRKTQGKGHPSLPSLPDDLEYDLREHFQRCHETVSTPLNPHGNKIPPET